jgi:hypothetical protein
VLAMPLLNGGGSFGIELGGGAGVEDFAADCERCRPSFEEDEDCLCLSELLVDRCPGV